MENLREKYREVALKAFNDGINTGNEDDLVKWIMANCSFDDGHLFFLVLGIGTELADIGSQSRGYDNQAHEIWQTKIAPNWKCDKNGTWTKTNK